MTTVNSIQSGLALLWRLTSLVILLLLGSGVSADESQIYAVISSGESLHFDEATTDDEKKSVIKQLYLKQRSRWPNGTLATPYSRPSYSKSAEAFLSRILEMEPVGIDQYWLQLRQITGEAPPRVISRDKALIRLVHKKPGHFGVVSKKALKNTDYKNVRVILYFTH